MIVSVHIADVAATKVPSILRGRPDPARVPGLRYAETTVTAPLGPGLLPTPSAGGVGLIASWEDDASLDAFEAEHPLAERFAGGWRARLRPLRVFGAWPEMEGLPEQELAVADDEPVAVLTLGKLRLTRVVPFLRASAAAEGEVLRAPGVLATIGLARPPRLVATFSLWRSNAEMRAYATRQGGAHPAATRSHAQRPFHHQSAFVRFRPYASSGSWDGRDPLAQEALAAASS
jgi:hypothetical protein